VKRMTTEACALLVVIVVMVSLCIHSAQKAREAIRAEDAHVLRQAITAYTTDKGKAPQSLEDLVTEGYLESIPKDPGAPLEMDPITPQERQTKGPIVAKMRLRQAFESKLTW
jgi:hypothetical protein